MVSIWYVRTAIPRFVSPMIMDVSATRPSYRTTPPTFFSGILRIPPPSATFYPRTRLIDFSGALLFIFSFPKMCANLHHFLVDFLRPANLQVQIR